MSHHINITRIKAIHNLLQQTGINFAFVGGATVSLYAQRETEEIRPTDDVDVVVEIATYGAGYTLLTEKLLQLGFMPDAASGVICRYLHKGLIVDVMPANADVLGFTNQWYKAGLANAVTYTIDPQHSIKIFSAPYFIASKLEAFHSRGGNDGRTSTDFEDIVYVMNNRPTLWDEMLQADAAVKQYLQAAFTTLLHNKYLDEWLMAHLLSSPPIPFGPIKEGMQRVANADAP